MNDTTVVISGNHACVVDRSTVTAGTVGGRVTFTFDKTWDGMEKTLVWKGSGVTLDDTACTGVIPAEVVAQAGGHLMVGVYGTRENTATPTLWADLGVILPGADPSGDESADPSLPVWAQLQQQLAAQEASCGKVKTVNGFEPDENGNVVIEGGLGEPGKTPVKGVDYFTEADKQEIAEQAAGMVELDGNVFTIVVNLDSMTADKTNEEIYEAYQAARPAYMLVTGNGMFPYILQPLYVFPRIAVFVTIAGTESAAVKITDDVVSVECVTLANVEGIPENVSALTNDAGYQTAADVKAIVDRELGVIENGTY